MKIFKPVCFLILILLANCVSAQKNARTAPERCGTMQNLEIQWQANPQLKQQFDAERARFDQLVRTGNFKSAAGRQANGNRAYITVPVVFHVVLQNPALVTDAQIQAQLDTLNKDYAGTNGDAVKVPSYFQSVFGQSGIQFCLARQTPDGDPTTGIERITTTKTSFLNTDDGVKHVASGGAASWDPSSYLNIWLCPLANSILGYGTFPGSGADADQGVVVEYRSIPGGSFTQYNGGKTLTHEIGHYFNLYHIWGDDNGACTGSDDIDDTPNQADASSTCPTGIKTDACTPSGNGIMYQDYMDYTVDNCLVMFTAQQDARMETALTNYRPSLLKSIGCQAAVSYNLDAQLRSVNAPPARICTIPFTPAVTIRNRGTQTLTTVNITTVLDNGTAAVTAWTGSLAQLASVDVNLKTVTPAAGLHTLKIYLSAPNGGTDQNTINDTISINFQYYTPVTSVAESFEGSTFPPAGWDVVNPDNAITWKKVTGVAKTGNSSVVINNFNYSSVGQKDYLRLPSVDLSDPNKQLDSAFISFQVAAAAYTNVTTTGNTWDTLEVVGSTDCGLTYTSLYKKWGSTLVTHRAADTASFVPTASEWRKDSVNISSYINTPNLLLAFRNTTGFENNVYLDDVNVKTYSVNKNLKSKGYLVTPNPTSGTVVVQFYPQPTDIKGIQVFNLSGQKVAEITSGVQSNIYYMDISRHASGIYIVRIVRNGAIQTAKIVKY